MRHYFVLRLRHVPHLMLKHSNPVRLGKERVRFDVCDTILHVAKSLGDVNLE